MMKLKIFNMKEFLKVVDTCTGAVNVVYSDGKKVNIKNAPKFRWTSSIPRTISALSAITRAIADIENPSPSAA